MDEVRFDRYAAADLVAYGTALLRAAGLPGERSLNVSEVLVEGDLLGHTTHGIALLAPYLEEIESSRMATEGEPTVVSDHGSASTWDAHYLPGPWVVWQAISEARRRLTEHPLVTIAIGRCHHIACLQAYLRPVTSDNLMIVLMCTDPANRWVAPFGAVEPVFSPNPIAVGVPTEGDPVLIDISTSTTAAGQCVRAADAEARLPGPWLVGADGRPTDDPGPLVRRREGALYPLGGEDLGYKGFGLALILEAMTSGLAGHGRSVGDARWGCSVLLQLIDPERFGGREAFLRETGFLSKACREAKTPPGKPPVRLPGEGALRRRAEQLEYGVRVRSDTMSSLAEWAARFGLQFPVV